jgi:hypothetical protein
LIVFDDRAGNETMWAGSNGGKKTGFAEGLLREAIWKLLHGNFLKTLG